MKLIAFLTAICFIITGSIASDTTITFRQINYTDAFELAKQEHKFMFLYFHFDGCGACKKMEKTTFIDKRVAKLINENFICFEVNTRKEEGIEINKIYNVQFHPTFMYLNENGNILHKMVGLFSTDEFLLETKNALSTKKTLSSFKAEYKQGNREADFLYEYCYKLRYAYELDSLLINEYLNTQSLDNLHIEKNIKFIYEFAIHHFKITMPFESKAFQYFLDNKDEFANYFESGQVDTRIVWIALKTVYLAIENNNDTLFNKALNVLSAYDNDTIYTFKEMDGRITGMIKSKSFVLSAKMVYYDKLGDSKNYNKVLQQYIDKIWNDSDALNKIAWDYYLNNNDKKHLEKAKKWIVQSININSNYANNDTYAALLYKLGVYDAALEQAEKAISIAKADKIDHQATIELINTIKEEIKKKNK